MVACQTYTIYNIIIWSKLCQYTLVNTQCALYANIVVVITSQFLVCKFFPKKLFYNLSSKSLLTVSSITTITISILGVFNIYFTTDTIPSEQLLLKMISSTCSLNLATGWQRRMRRGGALNLLTMAGIKFGWIVESLSLPTMQTTFPGSVMCLLK